MNCYELQQQSHVLHNGKPNYLSVFAIYYNKTKQLFLFTNISVNSKILCNEAEGVMSFRLSG